MLRNLSETVVQQVQGNAPWQVSAAVYTVCSSDATRTSRLPCTVSDMLPRVSLWARKGIYRLSSAIRFLVHCPNGRLKARARRDYALRSYPSSVRHAFIWRTKADSYTEAYEEWFKFHPDHLLPVLSYLVPSLTSTPAISRSAADALKALCDMCRKKLVQHIGAFSELHGKIGNLGVGVFCIIMTSLMVDSRNNRPRSSKQ